MHNRQLTSQDVERTIHQAIHRILAQQGKMLPAVSNAHEFQADLGFVSADLVQLLTALHTTLAADPCHSLAELRTVGELCQAYQQVLTGRANATADSDLLLASQRRAQARRERRKG
jgi:hypothetical protein